MKQKLILVTGATGHLGNVLVRELLEHGERVRVLTRPGKIARALEGLGVEIVPGDLLDPGSLERAMQGAELVYHLAARISLENGPDPETERVNYQGTLNILTAARTARIRRLVYASSIYALKKPMKGVLLDESQPFDTAGCKGAYDCSKARASLAVLRETAAGLDGVLVCPTAIIGPFDFHGSEAGRAIRLYMHPGMRFYVEGAYDFIDVRDAATGFVLAAEKGRSGEIYILSGGRMTVREVAQTIWQASGRRAAGIRVPLGLAYLAAGFMPIFTRLTKTQLIFTRYSLDAIQSNSQISHAKASQELGFTPRPVRQAILDAVQWLREGPGSETALSKPAVKTPV
jgi:dihydroflavonol-4-reductase